MGRNYWMFVESLENYEITKERGFTLHGMKPRFRRRAQRMQPDDRVLFYVSTIKKWTATTIITSQYFEDRTPIWNTGNKRDELIYRVKMTPSLVLDEEDYIDALILAPRLDYVKRWAPEDWPLAFFDSLHLLPQKDFRLIEQEMRRNLSKHKRTGRKYPNGRPDDISRREEMLEEAANEAYDEENQPLLDYDDFEDEDGVADIETDDMSDDDSESFDRFE